MGWGRSLEGQHDAKSWSVWGSLGSLSTAQIDITNSSKLWYSTTLSDEHVNASAGIRSRSNLLP
jgi:hypothetical protein